VKHLFTCVLVLGFWTITTAQTAYKPVVTEQQVSATQAEPSYPIAGSPRLNADWERGRPVVEAYEQTHPQQLRKTSAWNFAVGQTRAWWATDQSTSSQFEYQVPSTCKSVGINCYIFVEDALWNNGRVTQAAVDAMKNAFDSSTPADPTKGIYQLDTQYFGNPPNVDIDARIIILVLDVKDGWNGSGAYVAGYFQPFNEYPEGAVQTLGSNRHSNEAEIYYVDGNPTDLRTAYGITVASSTTAHEFQHMINWNYSHSNGTTPLTFVNEGLSEAAMALCGYTFENPKYYYSNTNLSFLSWGTTSNILQDYSRAGLFTWYLIEQFGSDVAKKIVQSTATGVAGYNDALSQMGTSKTFDDVLKSFAVANAIDDKSADSRYGFTLPITAQITPAKTYLDPNVSVQTQSIESRGTVYLLYKGGKNLSATFTSQYPTIIVRPIATGTGVNKVSDISLSSLYTEPGFGTSYNQVIFAVTNLGTAAASFSYSSSGQAPALTVQELAFEDGVPDGYLQLAAPDTAVVWFDALPGAILDSIKVAFRRDGSIGFGIWKYTGAQRPTPLGSNYGLITLNVTGSPSIPIPYPVPYPNWRKIDVSSWHVDLSSAFAVGFAFGATPTAPGLMISSEPYTQPHHSFTYDATAWYSELLNNGAADTAYKYVVRAYAHFGTVTGITQPIELVPSTFTLGNNYPNPFNPSTTIRYSIPTAGYVRLRVFDVSGREVASLVNGVQSAGNYVVNWHGTDDAGRSVASGAYFYTLESLGQKTTRRMVLLK
jgi:hypothetical protein